MITRDGSRYEWDKNQGENMKRSVLLSSLLLSTSLLAAPVIPEDQKIGTFTVKEISSEEFARINNITSYGMKGVDGGTTTGQTTPQRPTFEQRVENTGKVIQTARDIVALGEAIYDLVIKGKPTNVTEYAPISVVPKDPTTKEPVDVFDLEGFSMPSEKNYSASITNGVGKEVVKFSYKVLFSYGGSYNGAGKYLSGVIIVPGSVKTSFGWDFNASMKLSGIMNHGTKADPVAGVMVTMKYQMNSWSSSLERNDTIHITGRGEIKNMNR